MDLITTLACVSPEAWMSNTVIETATVADFWPLRTETVPYHHREGLWTYKTRQATWLTRDLPLKAVVRETFWHGDGEPHTYANRCEAVILRRIGK